jgi:flagellar motility protein MotE (MotC chaperone)
MWISYVSAIDFFQPNATFCLRFPPLVAASVKKAQVENRNPQGPLLKDTPGMSSSGGHSASPDNAQQHAASMPSSGRRPGDDGRVEALREQLRHQKEVFEQQLALQKEQRALMEEMRTKLEKLEAENDGFRREINEARDENVRLERELNKVRGEFLKIVGERRRNN